MKLLIPMDRRQGRDLGVHCPEKNTSEQTSNLLKELQVAKELFKAMSCGKTTVCRHRGCDLIGDRLASPLKGLGVHGCFSVRFLGADLDKKAWSQYPQG